MPETKSQSGRYDVYWAQYNLEWKNSVQTFCQIKQEIAL